MPFETFKHSYKVKIKNLKEKKKSIEKEKKPIIIKIKDSKCTYI